MALVRRKGRFLVPRGGTVLEEGDRLTILGGEEEIRDAPAEPQGVSRPGRRAAPRTVRRASTQESSPEYDTTVRVVLAPSVVTMVLTVRPSPS